MPEAPHPRCSIPRPVRAEPTESRKGIAGHLLDDAEQALHATGHRLSMVCLRNHGEFPQLRAWYRRRGYVFGPGDYTDDQTRQRGLRWRVQPRTTDDAAFDFIRGAMPVHAIGFKPLHPAVTVRPGTGHQPPTVTGLIDQA